MNGENFPRLRGVGRLGHAKTGLAEIAGQRIANVPLVIDQKDMGFAGHDCRVVLDTENATAPETNSGAVHLI